MNTLHGCLHFALVSVCTHSCGHTVRIFCKPPRQGSANERWSSGGLTSTTGDGARPCHRGPHVCSSSPRPGTAQWGRSPLSWRLGVQLWGQATSGCPGLSTAKPWSTHPNLFRTEKWSPAPRGPPLPAVPPGEAGFRADALTAWPPWPLRRCEGSLWGGAESGVELDWPCSPQASREQGRPAPSPGSIGTQPQAPGRRAGERQRFSAQQRTGNFPTGSRAPRPAHQWEAASRRALSSVSVYAWTAGPTTL